MRWRGEPRIHEAYGAAQTWPHHRPMCLDTVFDLASLTKPLATTGVTLALVDVGALALDEEVTRYLPELTSLRGAGITFRRLLTHTSGLPAWSPLYLYGDTGDAVLAAVDNEGITGPPGSRVQYSDLGFVVLGIAVERITGQRLDELAKGLIFARCGLRSATFLPPPDEQRFAATERGNGFEQMMLHRAGLSFDGWRQTCYPGQVNDGIAHYAMKGVSGNAGVFADAHDVGLLGQMWLDGGFSQGQRVLSAASVRLATTNQSPSGEAPRGLGWVLMTTAAPARHELPRVSGDFFPPTNSPWQPRPSGELLSPRAFGHTGFTGTSLWVDPAAELVAVLLTNATHPQVDLAKGIDRLRARFHNVLAAALEE
ncbi:MAG: serine hydrolase [Actinomycetota bacterium]|nr:serine hydrolase [Actinomycetota bacterium]